MRKEHLNFLIDLAIIAMVTEDKMTKEVEPSSFNKVWSHSIEESQRKWQEV